jgi:hypothetical protein
VPEEMEGLPERGSGVSLIGFGPEEGEESVASVEAVRGGRSEVSKQGQALGLRHHCDCFRSRGSPHRRGAKQPKLDRRGTRQGGAAGRHTA